MLTPEEVRSLFDRRQAHWNAHDAVELAYDHSEDCVVESPLGGRIEGRSKIESVYRGVFLAFPDMELKIQDLVSDGNKAAMLWSWRGTHVGEFCGLASSGRSFLVHGVFVYELKDSLIVHERRIYDFTGLLLQLGILKAKPSF